MHWIPRLSIHACLDLLGKVAPVCSVYMGRSYSAHQFKYQHSCIVMATFTSLDVFKEWKRSKKACLWWWATKIRRLLDQWLLINERFRACLIWLRQLELARMTEADWEVESMNDFRYSFKAIFSMFEHKVDINCYIQRLIFKYISVMYFGKSPEASRNEFDWMLTNNLIR